MQTSGAFSSTIRFHLGALSSSVRSSLNPTNFNKRKHTHAQARSNASFDWNRVSDFPCHEDMHFVSRFQMTYQRDIYLTHCCKPFDQI